MLHLVAGRRKRWSLVVTDATKRRKARHLASSKGCVAGQVASEGGEQPGAWARSKRTLGRASRALTLLVLSSCVQHGTLAPNLVGGRDMPLRYEGTCEHLACCSAHAVAVPAGTPGSYACDSQSAASCSHNRGSYAPGFTCNPREPGRYRQPHDPPYLACNDYERWLSIPGLSHEQCGERYLVCYRGKRVTAVARDRSASNESGNRYYEGSFGLLLALAADHDARETFVSIYTLDQTEQIAADPHCVGE